MYFGLCWRTWQHLTQIYLFFFIQKLFIYRLQIAFRSETAGLNSDLQGVQEVFNSVVFGVISWKLIISLQPLRAHHIVLVVNNLTFSHPHLCISFAVTQVCLAWGHWLKAGWYSSYKCHHQTITLVNRLRNAEHLNKITLSNQKKVLVK